MTNAAWVADPHQNITMFILLNRARATPSVSQWKNKMIRYFKFVARLLRELGAYAAELRALDQEVELEEG